MSGVSHESQTARVNARYKLDKHENTSQYQNNGQPSAFFRARVAVSVPGVPVSVPGKRSNGGVRHMQLA